MADKIKTLSDVDRAEWLMEQLEYLRSHITYMVSTFNTEHSLNGNPELLDLFDHAIDQYFEKDIKELEEIIEEHNQKEAAAYKRDVAFTYNTSRL